MKLLQNTILVFTFFYTTIIYAQTPPAVQQDLMSFEPGELIVKLKDNLEAGVTYAENGKAISSFNVGELLNIEDKVASSEVMFHQKSIEASIANSQRLKAVYEAKAAANPNNGYRPKEPLTMKNVFVVKTTDEVENILQLIQQIKDDPNVEYAEPNYIYGIDDFEAVSDIIYDKDVSILTTTSTTVPNDPLYSQQSNITETNIDDVWEQYTTGDGSQVVAILDTGVDYTHPDLEANIWINEAELNGVDGFDDDGNGYVDDVRGWDFINNDNTPLDDNMHGTHVAGIAGAVGGNGIGVAGAAWNVKLMPIKVFQSNGVGNSTTIAEGVNFATANGATIQNMSFGSYAESATLKAALENAYASSLLIAAAGNNKICIGPGLCPDNKPSAPLYPGAYSFVLGIEDSEGIYDNYDQDGAIFSNYSNFLNYEIKAPGTVIVNTVPNGGYRALTGTSMATPLISGAMALYLEQKPEDSKELIFGNLINTSAANVDIKAAIDVAPTPLLKVLSASIKDEIDNQNNNGFWEPGETLELFPLIKNYWGPTDDVRVGIEFAEFEDTSKAEIIENEIALGSITAYANLQDLNQSLKIKLADNIANNVNIKFELSVWSGDNQDYLTSKEIIITSTNAIILDGYVESDLHLTSGNEYIFAQNLVVTNNSILTIDPGVTVRLATNIAIDQGSKIYANGNKDNPIIFRPEQNASRWGGIIISDSDISQPSEISFSKLLSSNGGISPPRSTPSVLVNDVLIYDGSIERGNSMFGAVNANGLSIIDSYIEAPIYRPGNEGVGYGSQMYNVNSSGYLLSSIRVKSLWITNTSYGFFEGGAPQNSSMLDFYSEQSIRASNEYPIFAAPNIIGTFDAPGVYFGTGSIEILKSITSDFYTSNNTRIGKLNFSPVLLTPSEAPHGHVWKIEVNGNDAQDEYELMDPIGVGSNEFKVYFNRAMDTSVDPQVSYGVREPYNQKIISEQGTWSEDGKVYTVNHDVNIGAADGINRIRVQDAQDLDYFKIPVEDYRFNMLVQSAGSASTGFLAQGGLGKIDLEWTAPSTDEIDDALGYNMYRYQVDTDGVESDPEKLNETLIVEDTDESTTGVYFTDYEVVEGQTYFYKYKILRTSFEETDYSNAVSSAPLTSTLGDSNGDFEVDVLDLVQNVDYIVGNNPEPFIFVAGDVNADELINILDIVGTVDIIINGDTSSSSSSTSNEINFYPSNPVGDANFTWEGNDLYVESNFDIGGIQLAFNTDFDYILSEELPSIERLDYTQEDSKILMLYSFNNTVIASSKTKILTRLDASQEFDIEQAVVGTTSGAKLNAVLNSGVLSTIDAPFQNKNLQFLNLYPNPAEGLVHLEYYLPNQMDQVVAKVYDLLGRLVHIQVLENREGISKTPMELSRLKTGNYIVLITANKGGSIKNIANKKLIIE
jgi:subtilisin family serine protease